MRTFEKAKFREKVSLLTISLRPTSDLEHYFQILPKYLTQSVVVRKANDKMASSQFLDANLVENMWPTMKINLPERHFFTIKQLSYQVSTIGRV